MEQAPLQPTLRVASTEQRLAEVLAGGFYETFLQALLDEANTLCLSPDHNGRALYLPGFDSMLAKVAAVVVARSEPPPRAAVPWGVVIVASELAMEGGHSRVIEDICRSVANPLLIITDPYNRYADGTINFDFFSERVPEAMVMVLPRLGLFNKARALHQLCSELEPRNIFILTHHPDPTAFAGLSAFSTSTPSKKFLIHHADHNPALGMTIDGYVHVDCTLFLQGVCAPALGRPAYLLPLSSVDLGGRPGRVQPDKVAATVSSGSEGKFLREGPLAYADIVTRILTSTAGPHHHVGLLSDERISEIRAALLKSRIDPARFVYVGVVGSLWQSLKSIDADLYVASAPVGGGRAAIEAQGCGYPVAFFKSGSNPPLLQVDELYASPALGWSDLDGLQRCLDIRGAELAAFAQAARRHYLDHYSRPAFEAALSRLLSPGTH
jgi:hypothetical protein